MSDQLLLPNIASPSSLLEACERFLRRLDPELSRWTRAMHADHVRYLLAYFGPAMPVRDVNHARIQGYVEVETRRVMRETVRKRLCTLHLVLRGAHADETIDKLPAWPRIKSDSRKRGAFWTVEEWRRGRLACDDELRTFVDLGFWLGMHTHDLNRWRWRDLDVLNWTWVRYNTKNRATPVELPVPDELAAILAERADRLRPNRADLVIGRNIGHPNRPLADACHRADLCRMSPIDLRASCVTWLRDRGAPREFARLWMGHSVDSHTIERIYQRVSPGLLASGRDAMKARA